ncbi:uncharacterized protein LOC143593797 [Bidens hawaiensis]|uniref:uncharacterized protein LOC143593797 n=1 Tax=Bidens hawaiensis TaxID=980011 RepID=UPI00404A8DC8
MAQKKGRISWKQDGLEKTFLEACIEQITLHGREGSSLKLISWRNVAEKLKAEYNLIVDQRQMKNRHDYIKAKFAAWSKLKNKSGNSNKYIEALKSAPFSYPELCIQLFESSTSNGFDSWGPSSTLLHPSEEVSDLPFTWY